MRYFIMLCMVGILMLLLYACQSSPEKNMNRMSPSEVIKELSKP